MCLIRDIYRSMGTLPRKKKVFQPLPSHPGNAFVELVLNFAPQDNRFLL